MSQLAPKHLTKLCNSASWFHASGDLAQCRHFIESATLAQTLTDGASLMYCNATGQTFRPRVDQSHAVDGLQFVPEVRRPS